MANNLDRLFREGIDQYEVTPKAESWSAVQSQLAKKKKIAWIPMSIAAAIILMITATIIVRNYQVEQNYSGNMISSIDFPQQVLSPEKIEIPVDGVRVASQLVKNSTPKSVTTTPIVVKTEKEEQVLITQMETIHMVAIEEMNFSELPEVQFNYDFDIIKIGKPTVKITYIAENEPVDKKKKLGEFFNTITKEASPVDILADIRDAKDNIFSRN